MAAQAGIKEISQSDRKIFFRLDGDVKPGAGLAYVFEKYGERVEINGGTDPYIRFTIMKETPLEGIDEFMELYTAN